MNLDHNTTKKDGELPGTVKGAAVHYWNCNATDVRNQKIKRKNIHHKQERWQVDRRQTVGRHCDSNGSTSIMERHPLVSQALGDLLLNPLPRYTVPDRV
jgi:hypothetical protein